MSFYMTLPCTASVRECPNNTRGKYTTVLERELVLPPNYEAGIAEIFLPVPVINDVDSEMIYGSVDKLENLKSIIIKKEHTKSLEDIASYAGPRDANAPDYPYFHFELDDGKVSLHVGAGCLIKFHTGPLAHFLGFNDGYYWPGIHRAKHVERGFAYIYCDLCEHSIVGDTTVPCLRVIALKSNEKTALSFDNIHYVPVDGTRFSRVEVLVTDDSGEELRFDSGITIIKLHVRPRK